MGFANIQTTLSDILTHSENEEYEGWEGETSLMGP